MNVTFGTDHHVNAGSAVAVIEWGFDGLMNGECGCNLDELWGNLRLFCSCFRARRKTYFFKALSAMRHPPAAIR